MAQQSDEVTLLSVFVWDVASAYLTMGAVAEPLRAMLAAVDRDRAEYTNCPLSLYNEVCDWVENTFGGSSIVEAGRRVGERSFARMRSRGAVTVGTSPGEIMRELKRGVADSVKDPRCRGWEIHAEAPGTLTMRMTQSFNCMLQEGVLMSLLEQTGVVLPEIQHARCARREDACCEYVLKWVPENF